MNIVVIDLSAPSITCAEEYCALTGELDLVREFILDDMGMATAQVVRSELAGLFVYGAAGASGAAAGAERAPLAA